MVLEPCCAPPRELSRYCECDFERERLGSSGWVQIQWYICFALFPRAPGHAMGQNCRWRRGTREFGKRRGDSSRSAGGPTIVLPRLEPSLRLCAAHLKLAVALCGVYGYPQRLLGRDLKTFSCSHTFKGRREVLQSLYLGRTPIELDFPRASAFYLQIPRCPAYTGTSSSFEGLGERPKGQHLRY